MAKHLVTIYNRDTEAVVCLYSAATYREAVLKRSNHVARFPNDYGAITLMRECQDCKDANEHGDVCDKHRA